MNVYWKIQGYQNINTMFYCGNCYTELTNEGMTLIHPDKIGFLKTKPHPCKNAGKRVKSPLSKDCDEILS